MIGPGWLPTRPRPIVRRRTLPYMPLRAFRPRNRRARSPNAGHHEDMLFDQPPSELPVARLHQRGRLPSISHALVEWLAARWQWLRPRTVPVIVAFIGMCAVMASAHYLSKLATQTPPPERLHIQVAPNVAEAQPPLPPPSHYLVIDP